MFACLSRLCINFKSRPSVIIQGLLIINHHGKKFFSAETEILQFFILGYPEVFIHQVSMVKFASVLLCNLSTYIVPAGSY